MSTPGRHTASASPEPMGPFYVFEADRSAALGDVLRAKRADKAEALAFAETIHHLYHRRTYVLSAAGAMVRDFKSDEDVSK